MSHHAGYAAAIAIRGDTIQGLQRIAYHAGQIAHRLSGSSSGIKADLFLDLPRLEFHAADTDQVRVVLRAWGSLTVTPDGGLPPETHEVLVDVAVLVLPAVGLQPPADDSSPPRLTLALKASLPPIVSMNVASIDGTPYSAAADAVIQGSTFRIGVSLLIGQQLSGMTPSGLDAGFLGSIATAPSAAVTALVRDGALCVGIDVTDEPITGGIVTTTGDPATLVDFTGADDIAISINHVAAPLAFDSVRAGIAKQVDKAGARLSLYGFGVEDGDFSIYGKAENSEGSVFFSMKAVPQLTRSGYSREYDELWFDMRDITTDVNLSWWAALLGTLGSLFTLGFGVIVVEGLMASKGQDVTSDIALSSLQRRAARVQEFTLAGTSAPTIRLTLVSFDCFADEVYISSTLQPQFPAAAVSGPWVVPAEEAIAAQSLDFPLQLPFDLQPDDPHLKVRWTVTRDDTHEVVLNVDGAAAGLLVLRIASVDIPFLEASSFSIDCRVYRTLGAQVDELYANHRTLKIYDPVDRTHPYVHWTHEVWTPEVQIAGNGSRNLLGYAAKGRRSKLHRTDLPGRCHSVSHYSLNQVRDAGPGVTPSAIAYLDALPFPRSELVAMRGQVCDYCFFGGPTKAIPIVP